MFKNPSYDVAATLVHVLCFAGPSRGGLAQVKEGGVDEAELAETVSSDTRRFLVLMPRQIHLRYDVH